jgi:hypothetical protein
LNVKPKGKGTEVLTSPRKSVAETVVATGVPPDIGVKVPEVAVKA